MWAVNIWRASMWTRCLAEMRVWPSWAHLLSAPNLRRWISLTQYEHITLCKLRYDDCSLWVWNHLTGYVCLQESKWSLFKQKLKPSTTFENPSYSEVSLDTAMKNVLLTAVPKQKVRIFFQLVHPLLCFPDEGWKARREHWGPFCPRALSVCPPRQTSEDESSEHLFANRGQFQRHSQPRERGQRRVTPLSQTGIGNKEHTLHRINFFMQPVYKSSTCWRKEKYISIEWR